MATILGTGKLIYDFSSCPGEYGTGSNELIDVSGNNRHGTFNNSTSTVKGFIKSAVNFNGSNLYATLNDGVKLSFTQITGMIAINFNSFVQDAGIIGEVTEGATGNHNWRIGYEGTGLLFVVRANSDNKGSKLLSSALSTGVDYVISWSYASTPLAKIYINGQEPYLYEYRNTGGGTGLMNTGTQVPKFGMDHWGLSDKYLDAKVSYVELWDSVLTSSQVLTAYNEYITSKYTKLKTFLGRIH